MLCAIQEQMMLTKVIRRIWRQDIENERCRWRITSIGNAEHIFAIDVYLQHQYRGGDLEGSRRGSGPLILETNLLNGRLTGFLTAKPLFLLSTISLWFK